MSRAFFSKNSAQSPFIIYQCQTSYKESKKSLERFSGKSDNVPTQNSITNTCFCTLWMNRAFLQKSGSVTFHHFSISKSEKSLERFSRKSDYPLTQNSITNTRFCTLWMNWAFFQKCGSVTFHHLSMSNFLQRIRKIAGAVLWEK